MFCGIDNLILFSSEHTGRPHFSVFIKLGPRDWVLDWRMEAKILFATSRHILKPLAWYPCSLFSFHYGFGAHGLKVAALNHGKNMGPCVTSWAKSPILPSNHIGLWWEQAIIYCANPQRFGGERRNLLKELHYPGELIYFDFSLIGPTSH